MLAEEGCLRWTGLGIWAGRHGDGECVALCQLKAVLQNDGLLLAASFPVEGLMASVLLDGRCVVVLCLLERVLLTSYLLAEVLLASSPPYVPYAQLHYAVVDDWW